MKEIATPSEAKNGARTNPKQLFSPMKKIVNDCLVNIKMIHEGKNIGIPTGLRDLDKFLFGLRSGDLIVLGGSLVNGLYLQMARHVAITNKMAVAIFSSNFSKEVLTLKMIATESRVDLVRLQGFLCEMDWGKLVKAANTLSEAPLFIDDSFDFSLDTIRNKAGSLKENGLGMIIVDSFQSLKSISCPEISEVAKTLKSLALELNVPIIVISEVIPIEESKNDKTSNVIDFVDYDALKRYADLIIFLHWDKAYKLGKGKSKKDIAEIIIVKNKEMKIGSVFVSFLSKYGIFEDLS